MRSTVWDEVDSQDRCYEPLSILHRSVHDLHSGSRSDPDLTLEGNATMEGSVIATFREQKISSYAQSRTLQNQARVQL